MSDGRNDSIDFCLQVLNMRTQMLIESGRTLMRVNFQRRSVDGIRCLKFETLVPEEQAFRGS